MTAGISAVPRNSLVLVKERVKAVILWGQEYGLPHVRVIGLFPRDKKTARVGNAPVTKDSDEVVRASLCRERDDNPEVSCDDPHLLLKPVNELT